MRHTIVIVDDVPVNLSMLEAILESEYDIIKAANGKEALEKMSVPPFPSLALLDVSMPEIDGFELFEHMKEHIILKDVPVIFLTEGKDAYAEEKGLDMGAADYIKKPYLPGVILRKIRNQIELKMFRENLVAIASAQTRQLEAHAEELTASHSAILMGMLLLSESRDQVTGAHLAYSVPYNTSGRGICRLPSG